MTATAGTPDALTVKWAAVDFLVDGACKDATILTGVKDETVNIMNGGGAALADGATNDLTVKDIAGADLCVEKWNVGTSKTRCVRTKLSFSRKFITPLYTTKQKAADVPFDYRKYEVTASWKWNAQTTEPLATTFSS